MASGTKIRPLARLLDASESAVWAIDSQGKLIYLSASVARWLGVDVEKLLGRRSIAGAPISDDPLDYVAASLSPPSGLQANGTARLKVQPPAIEGRRIDPRDVRFVRLGKRNSGATIAIAGDYQDADRELVNELNDARLVRQQLDAWRKHHQAIATIATAGTSSDARRLRNRLHVAASTRTHVGFFGPPGSGAESIALHIHSRSTKQEPVGVIDGPLMDPELLDASIAPMIQHLANGSDSRASVLVRGLDEMSPDASQRLADLMMTFGGRLRLLGLCGPCPTELTDPLNEGLETLSELSEKPTTALLPRIADFISSLTIRLSSLADRVEDIPLMAAAIVDVRHAAGEGPAERISRAALDTMISYPWPKNFVELDESIRHAIRMARGESILAEHLPLAIRSFHVPDPNRKSSLQIPLDQATKQFEMNLIREALDATDGNRAEAARKLGISRARLLRKLDESKASPEP